MAKVGHPRTYKSPEQMQKAIDEYFDECDAKEKPYLISGLCLKLGFLHRSDLVNYSGYSKVYHNIITRARQKVQAYAEAKCYEKHSQGAQFILNAGHNWSTNAQVREERDTTISLGDEERELLAGMGSKLIESRVVASIPPILDSESVEKEKQQNEV